MKELYEATMVIAKHHNYTPYIEIEDFEDAGCYYAMLASSIVLLKYLIEDHNIIIDISSISNHKESYGVYITLLHSVKMEELPNVYEDYLEALLQGIIFAFDYV